MKKQFLILSILLLSIKLIALNPLLPPGSNFDLSAWKLQTLDQNLLFTEISASSLGTGYTSSLFYTDSTDGSIVFKVPSNGTPTSGSTYPRVELRQMTNGANWVLNDPTLHYMTAQCKVLAVAQAKPQTIIGQIHGSSTINPSEMIKLRWNGYLPKQCYVEARFKTNDATFTEYGVTLATGLSLGDLITYTITMQNGTINCTVNGTTGSQTYTPDVWTLTDAYYFKAGNYLQYNPNSVSPPDPTVYYGQNQFYKLSLINVATDVPSVSELYKFNIYPNPVKDKFYLSYNYLTTSNVNVDILDISGRTLKSITNPQTQFSENHDISIDVSNMKDGIYFARIKADNLSKTIRFIIGN